MNSTTVLVMSNDNGQAIAKALFDLGFEPLRTVSMPDALTRLRRETFAAAFVD